MKKPSGFTLIEMVVVLFIMGVVLAMAMGLTRAVTTSAQRTNTTKALANVDLALANFVMLTKRLPCPADGAAPADGGTPGVEMRNPATGLCTTQAAGVAPWVTLGLAEQDVLDGYGNRITYRVGADLVLDSALWMTDCDAAGTAAAVPGNHGTCAACPPAGAGVPGICTPPLNAVKGRGLTVKDGTSVAASVVADPSNASAPTGAAYVLISHGQNQAYAFTTAGVLNPGTSAASSSEAQNDGSKPLQAYYVDQSADASFDDILSRPAVLAVVNRANLGPRAHL